MQASSRERELLPDGSVSGATRSLRAHRPRAHDPEMRSAVRVHSQASEALHITDLPIAPTDLVECIRARELSRGRSEEEADAAVEDCLTGDTLRQWRRLER